MWLVVIIKHMRSLGARILVYTTLMSLLGTVQNANANEIFRVSESFFELLEAKNNLSASNFNFNQTFADRLKGLQALQNQPSNLLSDIKNNAGKILGTVDPKTAHFCGIVQNSLKKQAKASKATDESLTINKGVAEGACGTMLEGDVAYQLASAVNGLTLNGDAVSATEQTPETIKAMHDGSSLMSLLHGSSADAMWNDLVKGLNLGDPLTLASALPDLNKNTGARADAKMFFDESKITSTGESLSAPSVSVVSKSGNGGSGAMPTISKPLGFGAGEAFLKPEAATTALASGVFSAPANGSSQSSPVAGGEQHGRGVVGTDGNTAGVMSATPITENIASKTEPPTTPTVATNDPRQTTPSVAPAPSAAEQPKPTTLGDVLNKAVADKEAEQAAALAKMGSGSGGVPTGSAFGGSAPLRHFANQSAPSPQVASILQAPSYQPGVMSGVVGTGGVDTSNFNKVTSFSANYVQYLPYNYTQLCESGKIDLSAAQKRNLAANKFVNDQGCQGDMRLFRLPSVTAPMRANMCSGKQTIAWNTSDQTIFSKQMQCAAVELAARRFVCNPEQKNIQRSFYGALMDLVLASQLHSSKNNVANTSISPRSDLDRMFNHACTLGMPGYEKNQKISCEANALTQTSWVAIAQLYTAVDKRVRPENNNNRLPNIYGDEFRDEIRAFSGSQKSEECGGKTLKESLLSWTNGYKCKLNAVTPAQADDEDCKNVNSQPFAKNIDHTINSIFNNKLPAFSSEVDELLSKVTVCLRCIDDTKTVLPEKFADQSIHNVTHTSQAKKPPKPASYVTGVAGGEPEGNKPLTRKKCVQVNGKTVCS